MVGEAGNAWTASFRGSEVRVQKNLAKIVEP